MSAQQSGQWQQVHQGCAWLSSSCVLCGMHADLLCGLAQVDVVSTSRVACCGGCKVLDAGRKHV
jgi:hypothetical protein